MDGRGVTGLSDLGMDVYMINYKAVAVVLVLISAVHFKRHCLSETLTKPWPLVIGRGGGARFYMFPWQRAVPRKKKS